MCDCKVRAGILWRRIPQQREWRYSSANADDSYWVYWLSRKDGYEVRQLYEDTPAAQGHNA